MRLVLTLALSCLAAFSEAAPRAIHGMVVDAATHLPISGAWVNADGEILKTGANGEFQFKTKATSIALRATGYGRVIVPAGEEMRVPLPPLRIHGLYMSFWAASSKTMRSDVLETAAKAHLNALVIDVKGDMGLVGIRTTIPLVAKTGAGRVITMPDAAALLADLHQRGLYVIARIVTFKDSPLALARPELAVKLAGGGLFADNEKLHWTDPFSAAVWDYNIQIAVAAAKAGFDEIQFDYVRFPDHKGLQFSKENNETNRRQAISGFLAQALGGYFRLRRLEPGRHGHWAMLCRYRQSGGLHLADAVSIGLPLRHPRGTQSTGRSLPDRLRLA
jgi:hypothetical protein